MSYGINFDATDVNPNEGFDAIPIGDYEVIMIKDEKQESKAQPGNSYVNCTYRIVAGPYTGRLLFDKLYLEYKPATASIARSRLASICCATGRMKIENALLEIYNIPIIAKVTIEKYDGKDQNKVDKFVEIPSSLPQKTEQANHADSQGVEGGEEKPAWQK